MKYKTKIIEALLKEKSCDNINCYECPCMTPLEAGWNSCCISMFDIKRDHTSLYSEERLLSLLKKKIIERFNNNELLITKEELFLLLL